MASSCYARHAQALLDAGRITPEMIDDAVRRILRIKFRLGLFEHPYVDEERLAVLLSAEHRAVAQRLAAESCVLLKNNGALPLSPDIRTLAVIGPLADAPLDQLGCWVFDGRAEDTLTPLRALTEALAGRATVRGAAGLPGARSLEQAGFAAARQLAAESDAVVLILGEDAALTGEAHSRAFLELPGAQTALLAAVAESGKPLIVVVMAGRPLVLTEMLDHADALLYAWHPGTMGGGALADLLLGVEAPSGKLPVSFPRAVGQIPTYYNHKNTGRPPLLGEGFAPTGTPLNPKNFTASYLDVDPRPLFPFGHGLTYTTFAYSELALSTATLHPGESLTATVTLANTGERAAVEVVQLYVRDLVGSVTRPVQGTERFPAHPPGARRPTNGHLHPPHRPTRLPQRRHAAGGGTGTLPPDDRRQFRGGVDGGVYAGIIENDVIMVALRLSIVLYSVAKGVDMASITVKDIPDELYQRFKETAQQDRRSLNAEVIVAMETLIQQHLQLQERQAALQRINERRRRRPRNVVDSLTLLREDRER